MKPLTLEQIESARIAWESGEGVAVIAGRLGCSAICIHKRAERDRWDAERRRLCCESLRTGRFVPKPQKPRVRLTPDVRRLFEAGAPSVEVLAIAGMGDSGLRARAVREGWDSRARRLAIAERSDPSRPRCHDCGEQKDASEFYPRHGSARRGGRCKTCTRLRARARDWRLDETLLSLAETCAIFAAAKCCVYCERPLKSREKTLDHVIPLSRGGRHERENVAIACRFCNTSKGARTPLEWILSRMCA